MWLLLSKEHDVLYVPSVSCYTWLHLFLLDFYIFFPVCQLTFCVFAVQTLDKEDLVGLVSNYWPHWQMALLRPLLWLLVNQPISSLGQLPFPEPISCVQGGVGYHVGH